jgi:hypothetical protein
MNLAGGVERVFRPLFPAALGESVIAVAATNLEANAVGARPHARMRIVSVGPRSSRAQLLAESSEVAVGAAVLRSAEPGSAEAR